MKVSIISIIALYLCTMSMNAQALKQQGTSVEQIVPEGWEHHEVLGDLNKDGVKDLVIVAKPNFKENMKTRDDGYVYNFNKDIIAIYFAQPDGSGFQCFRQYKDLIPPSDEWSSVDVSIEVTNRYTLNISTSLFSSGGSYGTNQTKYTYRYQNSDFYQIGLESTEMMRNTGDMTTVSENYLTWKRQTIKDNAFEEGMKKETWSKLTKKPLEKLGEKELF